MTASTRRAALGAILAVPLASAPAIAAPPSDLAMACLWAVGHRDFIDDMADREAWDDDRVARECDRHEAVIVRAIEEPSRSLGDLRAKARLLRQDFECGGVGLSEFNDDRLAMVVLAEVIALCASSSASSPSGRSGCPASTSPAATC